MELGEGVILAHGLRIHHGTCLSHSQEAERGDALPLRLLSLFYSFQHCPHGMVLHITTVGLPTSTLPRNSLTNAPISQVIPVPIGSAMGILTLSSILCALNILDNAETEIPGT